MIHEAHDPFQHECTIFICMAWRHVDRQTKRNSMTPLTRLNVYDSFSHQYNVPYKSAGKHCCMLICGVLFFVFPNLPILLIVADWDVNS